MRIRIHRGTHQIGGTCIELEADGSRILLDLGLPLDGDAEDPAIFPDISGLAREGARTEAQPQGSKLLALLLSHGHLDHYGLAHLALPGLPVAMGAATHRILQAAAPFLPRPYVPSNVVELKNGEPAGFGPFRVWPYLVDHSAFDSYAFLVEAGQTRLLYSGDLRAHGRKGKLFERLIARPPENIDVLLLEGSSLGRLQPAEKFPAETEVEQLFADLFRSTDGMVLAAASAQNIDRMVSIYRACKQTRRTFVIDLYTAEILRATGSANIPQSSWPNVALFVPQYQRRLIKRTGRFDLLQRHSSNRVFAERLATIAQKACLLFRPPMLPDLDRAHCLAGAHAVWSQWAGYLEQERGQKLLSELQRRDIALRHAHTSGHASIPDLQRLVAAIKPRMLVPIHTFEPENYPTHFGTAVSIKQDGEWWELAA